MKTELILKSDVLDIVFDNRNKAYGAYDLRKYYDNRLIKSIAVMLGMVLVLSAFTFLPNKKVVNEKNTLETITANILKEKKEIDKPKQEIARTAQKPTQTKKWVANFLFVKDTTKLDALDVLNDDVALGSNNVDVPDGSGQNILVPTGTGGGDTPGSVEAVKPTVDATAVLDVAEVMPEYPGGIKALIKFLERNLTNPRDMEEGEMVSVKVKFVVGVDGKLKSFNTVQDGGEEFNKEVIRVLKKMPEWIPGKSRGQNVSVYYTIPVKFVSEN